MKPKTEVQAKKPSIPNIPLKFEDAVVAALETPPERKKPKKKIVSPRKK